MRLRTIFLIIGVLIGCTSLMGAIVESAPSVIDENSTGVRIIYHADQGNRGLQGYTGDVYAHTGVITNQSASGSDWKHAPSWGDNNPKYKLTRTSTDTYELAIGNIREYYGVTSSDEKVLKLAFVFRSGDKSKEGKTASGGDIFLELGPKEEVKPSPMSTYPGGKPKMGAVKGQNGQTLFCIAAPGKTSVSIKGSWDGMASKLMNYQDYQGFRYFWTEVKNLEDGKDYYYYYDVEGETQVADPYSTMVLDPANDQYLEGWGWPEEIKGVGNLVTVYNSDQNDYDWKITNFEAPEGKDLVIYEMLIRDFTGTEGEARGNGTIASAMEKLDYLSDLGVNAVELMPVMEFSGNNSWGYNPNFYFAPDKAYGSPDELKEFVDECHRRGMAVILDVVFNHADGQNPWVQMYPQGGNPFINAVAPHDYSVFNDWKQENALVRQMQDDCLRYWMETYRVDGFRFDLVKGMGDSDSYAAGTEAYNKSRVANMERLRQVMLEVNPLAIHINENLAGAQEENEMAQSGQLNWSNINHNSRQYAAGNLQGAGLKGFYAPEYSRTWGSTVAYAESHDEERMGYEQYSRGANDYVKRDMGTRMTRLGSLAAQMLMLPGAKMIWQFQELGNDQTTKQSSGDNDTSPKKVRWTDLEDEHRAGLRQTYKELIALRKNNPGLFSQQSVVESKISDNDTDGRYIRLANGSNEMLLLVNPDVKEDKTVTAPASLISKDNFQIMAKSQDATPLPLFSPGNVQCRLGAGEFVIIGTPGLTEMDDLIHNDASLEESEYYTLQGMRVSEPSHGVYIMRQGGRAKKIML